MDILQVLARQKSAKLQRGSVVQVGDQSVSVRFDDGVRQVPKGIVLVKQGDEVVVQGNQLVGKRKPVNNVRTYSA